MPVPAGLTERALTGGLLLDTAPLYLAGLDRSGWGNSVYAAAAQAGARNWAAFFFGSSVAGNSITVDTAAGPDRRVGAAARAVPPPVPPVYPYRMRSRREFLQDAGTGAAGLVAGAALGRLTVEKDTLASGAERRRRERAGAAGDAVRTSRLGALRVVWSLEVTEPAVALSFDDGPTPEYTPRILAALAAADATAMFNVMGRNAVRHPGLLREVGAAGHQIGNHTWTHQDLTRLDPARTREQIVRGAQEIEEVLGRPVTTFRPPRGELTGYALRVCAELGYEVHMWSCTRGEGGWTSPGLVSDHIGRTALAGDVIGLHDGLGRGTFAPHAAFARALAERREVEVRALPEALRLLRERGLRLVSVADLPVAEQGAAAR